MTRAEIIALVLILAFTGLLIFSAVKLHQTRQRWAWLHPPEDDDGVTLLEEEDDPDGNYSR